MTSRPFAPALLAVCLPLCALASGEDRVTEGGMRAVGAEGATVPLPLEHTDVQAEISGFVSRVQVVQTFKNPFGKPIEAIYVFPLPDQGVVDGMTMTIGERVIRGEIKRRQEAREIYERAKSQGRTAALLDQERPNIFTQSVANILPGESIKVTLTYVAPLEYDHGRYTFNFPMVVGPRYVPGTPLPSESQGSGTVRDTDRVPDASRISPPLLADGRRSGHDIAVTVRLDAGVPLRDVRCTSHEVAIVRRGMREAEIRLNPADGIANRDFILRYDVAGERLQAGILTHRDERGGFFTLMIQPQADFRTAEITPREMFFVIDQSCSQSGLPMEKQKAIVQQALRGMHPNDTFNVVTFASGVSFFSPNSLPNRPEHVQRAQAFVSSLQANGGTEMAKGIVASLGARRDPERLRMVLFLSDGLIGNDDEILAEVQERIGNARLFAYGVGNSVNHYLLRRMAEVGRGYYQYSRTDEPTAESVERFYSRIAKPYLVDVSVDLGDLGVREVYPDPKRLGDLFVGQPIILTGRYEAGGRGRFALRGRIAGRRYEERVEVDLPRTDQRENEALASMFGRAKIEHLSQQQYRGERPEIVQAITETALKYRLMSAYTSFVAVDSAARTEGGTAVQVVQPVPVPQGTVPAAFGVAGGVVSASSPMPPAPLAANSFVAREPPLRLSEGSVEGDLVRPEGSYLASKKKSRFDSMVQVRPDFNDKLKDEKGGSGAQVGGGKKVAQAWAFELADVVIRGPLTRAEVRAALDDTLRHVAKTHARPAAKGAEVVLRITFAADGAVMGVRTIREDLGSAGVSEALRDGLSRVRASAKAAATIVTVRLVVR